MTQLQPKPRHFFAASVREWRVNADIKALIRAMDRERMPYSLWFVPTDITEDYDIEFYAPQVAGAVLLTTIHPKPKA